MTCARAHATTRPTLAPSHPPTDETDQFHGKAPSLGSGVVFINQTERAKAVLVAWSEAMANDNNAEAPDDQVLGLVLNGGGFLERAAYGWLPASYLRTMPWFYRVVVCKKDADGKLFWDGWFGEVLVCDMFPVTTLMLASADCNITIFSLSVGAS